MIRGSVAGAFAGLLVVTGCADPGLGDELHLTELAVGFDGPTQIAVAPDRRLLVAELNGGEGEGSGRIMAVSLDEPSERTVLIDDLLTPTGVAVDGDRLWVMEQRRLTVGPLDDPSDRSVVLDDLPFNGRSQGTLTALPGGGIVYDTSGSRDASLSGGTETRFRNAVVVDVARLATPRLRNGLQTCIRACRRCRR